MKRRTRKQSIQARSRAVLVTMMRDGQCSQAEAAALARVSRQAVAQWLDGDVDLARARSDYLLSLYARLLNADSRVEA